MHDPSWHPPAETFAARLQQTWTDEIPLAGFMRIGVTSLDAEGIRMHAPLAPNLNHMGTGFAGSIASLATLTGWAACQAMVHDLPPCDAMVHDVRMLYSAPVRADLASYCGFPALPVLETFRSRLLQRGRAHLELTVVIESDDVRCAELSGRFVAVLGRAPRGEA